MTLPGERGDGFFVELRQVDGGEDALDKGSQDWSVQALKGKRRILFIVCHGNDYRTALWEWEDRSLSQILHLNVLINTLSTSAGLKYNTHSEHEIDFNPDFAFKKSKNMIR